MIAETKIIAENTENIDVSKIKTLVETASSTYGVINEDLGEPKETVDTTTHTEEGKQVQQPQARLSKKEITTLKRTKYDSEKDKYKTSYIILNKKTGMVVEMKAASVTHACTMIGWRIKNCKLIDTIIEKEEIGEKQV